MIGTGELIVILCVILVLFGGKKLPEFARSLGQGIREFKRACRGEEAEEILPIELDGEKPKKTKCNHCSSCSPEE